MYTPKNWEYAHVEFYACTEKTKALEENRKKALQFFTAYLEGNGYEPEPQDLIIIEVESYKCIAFIVDEFEPKEILRIVQPFDETQVYPRQLCVQSIRFANYRECMECEEWPPM